MYGLAVLLFRVSLLIAGIAGAYLLWGLLSGQLNNYAGLPRAERVRIFDNLVFAGNVLRWSVAAAALFAACVYYDDPSTGYLLVLAGLALWAGVPHAYAFLISQAAANRAAHQALVAFPGAAAPLWILGGALIARDVVLRLLNALGTKTVERDLLQYGGDAEAERAAPAAVKRFMGKCWQGPYCREFIRVHCPIFQARKACWRVKKGCYCEPEIINTVVDHISGPQLAMAPQARYNFANDAWPGAAKKTELTYAQKCERCRHCVIYNQHQREKYALLVPVTIAAVALIFFFGAPLLRQWLELGLGGIEDIMKRFTFGPASQSAPLKFRRPGDAVEWVLIVAFGVMALSKALQTLEWAIFKKMI